LSEGRMDNSNVPPRLMAEHYVRAHEKVARSLREYLGDPDEENTRTLRASVRRLYTILSVVPKRSRKKTMKQSRDRCRKVLKAASRVRDVDIISERLSKLSPGQSEDLLLANLREEREEYVSDSMKAAWRLFETHRPKAERKEFRGSSRWVRRALVELDATIAQELPTVVKNEGKVDELHSLRKHAKTFRYVLELVPTKGNLSKATESLRTWQDVLGGIRDSDIVIEYLGRARQTGVVRQILLEERTRRHRRYRSFVRSYDRDLKGETSLFRLAGFKRGTSD
jgi:CHAD domain-containing protein